MPSKKKPSTKKALLPDSMADKFASKSAGKKPPRGRGRVRSY